MPAITTAFAQGVAASRPAAATSNAGFMFFATDTGILSQSTGSSWTTIGPAVALDALTTKGDVLTRTSSAYGRLGVGSDAQVLTADSTQSTGLKWATPTSGFSDPMSARGDLIVRGAGGTTRLALGSSGQYLKSDGTDAAWAAASGLYTAYLCYQDQKAQNTSGGTFTTGAWRTRDLNTEVADTGNNGSVAANQITLAAGTYVVRAALPAFYSAEHQGRLQNITDGATLLVGTSGYSPNASSGWTTHSLISGRFTLAGTKVVEVQHQSGRTQATNGFGVPNNFTTEIYTTIELWKE